MDRQKAIERVDISLRSDILRILGLPSTHTWEYLYQALLGKATRQLAEIALTFDHMIIDQGINKAAEWSLTNWCRDIYFRCKGNIPSCGPLLIISNHPGAYDALVIASKLPRPDLRIIVSDLPFFHALDNFPRKLFFIPMNIQNASGRMAGMLSAIKYLKNGGAVLLMGSGTIDPDPAVYHGAFQNIQRWTDAVTLFLRFVPNANIVLSAVSHILHPKWVHHPLTWLQKGAMEKRRIAEFCQVMQQLFLPGSLYVSPCLSFSPIIQAAPHWAENKDFWIKHEMALLAEHCRIFGGDPA